MKRTVLPLLLACGLIGIMGCDTQSPTQTVSPSASPSATPTLEPFALTSSAFANGGVIADKYGYNFDNQHPVYENKSIPLHWGAPPAGTKTLALLMEDKFVEDHGGHFVHWAIVDMPADTRDLPEGVSQTAQMKGTELAIGSGAACYTGPWPVGDTHEYRFTLYALDAEHLTIEKDPLSGTYSYDTLKAAITAHTLGSTQLSGSFTMPMPQ